MSGETITIADLLLGVDVAETPDAVINRAVQSVQARVNRQKIKFTTEFDSKPVKLPVTLDTSRVDAQLRSLPALHSRTVTLRLAVSGTADAARDLGVLKTLLDDLKMNTRYRVTVDVTALTALNTQINTHIAQLQSLITQLRALGNAGAGAGAGGGRGGAAGGGLNANTQQLLAQLERLNNEYKRGDVSADFYARRLGQLQTQLRTAAGAAQAGSAEFRALDRGLTQISQGLRNVDSAKITALRTELAGARAQFDAAAAAATNLAQRRAAIAAYEGDLNRIRAALAGMAASGNLTTQQMGSLQRMLAQIAREGQTINGGVNLAGLSGNILNALNSASGMGGVLGSVAGQASGFASSIQGITSALGPMGVAGVAGAAVIAGLGMAANKAVNEYAKLEYSLAMVSTLTDKTSAQLGTTKTALLEMSREVGSSTEELAKGLYDILGAGVDGTNDMTAALGFLKTASKLAVAGMTETSVATDVLTSVMNAYKMNAAETGSVSDKLFRTVDLGKISFEQLARSLGMVTAISSQAGVSLDETLAALATMTANGIQASSSVDYLRSLIKALVSPGEQARAIFDDLGVAYGDNALKSKGLVGVLQDLMQKTGGSTDLLSKMLGGVEAVTAATSIASGDFNRMNESIRGIGQSAGATETAYGKMADTLKKENDKLDQNWSSLWKNLGAYFAPFKTDVISFMNDALDKLNKWIERTTVARNAMNAQGNIDEAQNALNGERNTLKALQEQRARQVAQDAPKVILDRLDARIADSNAKIKTLEARLAEIKAANAQALADQTAYNVQHGTATLAPGVQGPNMGGSGEKVDMSAVAPESGKLGYAFISTLTRTFKNDPKVPSDCAIIASYVLNHLGLAIKNSASARDLMQNALDANWQKVDTSSLKNFRPGDLVTYKGADYGLAMYDPNTGKYLGSRGEKRAAGGVGYHSAVYAGLNAQGQHTVIENPGKTNTRLRVLTEGELRQMIVLRSQQSAFDIGGNIKSGALSAPDASGAASGSGTAVKDLKALQTEFTRLTAAYKSGKMDVDAYRTAVTGLRSEAEKLAATQGVGTQAWEKTQKFIISTSGAIKQHQAGVKSIVLTWDQWTKNREKALALAAREQKLTEGKLTPQQAIQLKADVAAYKKNPVRAAALEEAERQLAQQKANTERAAAAEKTAAQNRAQAIGDIEKNIQAGKVDAARAALERLKQLQADQLALEGKTAADRERIVKATGPAILRATYALNAEVKRQTDAATVEWSKSEQAKSLTAAEVQAEITRRNAQSRAVEKRANLQAQQEQNRALRELAVNRADEEKRLAAELSALQIEKAEATAARLKTIHDAEIKAAEGNLSKQQAMIAKYAEQEYQTALKLADMKRDQRVAAAKGPNASAEVQAANAAYDATAAAALVTRDQAISGAAKATTASVRALRDEYGRLAESIREKVKAGQFDEAAQLAAARSFNELGRKARAAGLDQNTFIEGARKSAWATLQAGKGAEEYRQTLLDLDAEMEASAAGQKAAADAAVTLSNSLEGLGDREGAMQVLNEALDQVMEAAGRGEVVGEAISILTGQIDRLNATLDQGALERAATYLHHIREDAEAAAEATLTASEANLTEKEFADRDRVRALARTGPEALLNFLGGPDNEFFGDQFWTQLGEFGRGEFLAAFEKITPDQLGRLGPDFLKAFRDQIDPDDPTFAGIRARVDEGLTRAYRQVGDADVQTDLNRILREAQDLQAGFTNWDDPVALMEYRDRLRELAAELGLLKVAAADGQWAQDVEGAFASVTASADEAQQSLTELLDVLSTGTPDEVVTAANAIGESAMTALNKAALDYQLGVIDGEAYNKVLEEQAALLAPVLAKLEAMGPEYANVAAGIRLVIQATKDMKAEGDPNPGPDATPTGADTLAADTIGNLLRLREGVKDGSISVAQFRTEVASVLPDVEALATQFEQAGRTDLAKTLRGAAGEMRALGGWTVKALEGLAKFTTYADYFKQIAGSFGKLTAALGEGEEDYDRLTGKKLQTPWKDLSANIDGAVNLASKLMDMATDVMKIIANPADIGAWVSLITKVVSSIADAIAGFQKAKAEVARLKAEFAEDNPLLNPADYQKTFTRSRGWLADIFGGGPEVVNEIDKLGMIFARSMQDGLMNGIKNGLKEAIKQNDMSLFGKYLREGVGDAILTGIVDSFIQGELMKNTLAPAIKAWSDAMKTTDDPNDDIAALAGIDTAVTTAIGLAERFGKDVVPRLSTLRDKGYFGDPSDPGSSGGGSAFGNAPGVQYGLPRVEVTFPPEFIQAASDIRTGGSDLRLGAAEFRLGVAEFREALRARGGAPALSAQGGLA